MNSICGRLGVLLKALISLISRVIRDKHDETIYMAIISTIYIAKILKLTVSYQSLSIFCQMISFQRHMHRAFNIFYISQSNRHHRAQNHQIISVIIRDISHQSCTILKKVTLFYYVIHSSTGSVHQLKNK